MLWPMAHGPGHILLTNHGVQLEPHLAGTSPSPTPALLLALGCSVAGCFTGIVTTRDACMQSVTSVSLVETVWF
jgi:hypothetical protein